MMEAKLANFYLEEEKRRKLNMVMGPMDFNSVKQNAIELNYDILEVLGVGARGKTIVKKIRNRELNVIRVLKIISKSKYSSPVELKTIKSDLSVMKIVDHPNIVKIYEYYEDDANLYVIMEYCSGGLLIDGLLKKEILNE